jgi:Domain of unknown function (DUF4167)
LNNNRGNNNNRRRGRGNRPQGGGGGGGQQLNRIDSRARGNAPQMLEKYRKLAHDAHLNGDRVQAEYYLQFADHYFRVIADSRLRVEEQRLRRDDRWEGGPEEAEEAGEFSVDNDFPSYDQQNYPRPQRDDRPRPPRQSPEERFDSGEDAPSALQAPQDRFEDSDGGDEAEAQANPYEPPENPFVRENRVHGGLRPRRDDRRPRRDERAEEPAGLDPASLPPSIGAPRDEVDADDAPAKPRRGRPPKRKPAADGAGEALESVS